MLYLFLYSNKFRTQEKSTQEEEIDEFTCSLHGMIKTNSKGKDEVHLRVEYEPTDKSMVYKFRILVEFSAKCSGYSPRKKLIAKECRHNLAEEDQQKNFLSANIVLGRIESVFKWDFSANIKFELFECNPILPSFEFKDGNLSNFKLIVGDTDFYTGKDILAYNSPQIYTLLYGGKSPIDGTEVPGDKNLNELNIDDVEPKMFHKFLCMLLAYKAYSIEDDAFIDFVKLSHKFSSTQMLQECEIAYFKMNSRTKEKHRLAAATSDVVKTFLEKLDEKIKNVKLMEAVSKTFYMRSFDEHIKVGGVSFRVRSTYDKQSNYRKLKVECLYKDASTLWKHTATFQYTDRFGKEHEVTMTFSASHRTCDIGIPYVSNFIIRLDTSWGTYENRKHSFDEHIDNLTDVVLAVPGKKFYVNKQILANTSTYFHSIFYSGFREKNQSEIELHDVDASDLEEFLHHVYYPKRAVKDRKLENLLDRSRFYDAPEIRKKCVQFMYKATNSNTMKAAKSLKRKHWEELCPLDKKVRAFEKVLCMEGIEELNEETKTVLSKRVKELKEICQI